MRPQSQRVSQRLLEEFAAKSATSSLNMHDPTRSTAKIIRWRGKAWICTGYVISYHKITSLKLREVLPVSMWSKPFNDLKKRGPEYYTGGRFCPKGRRGETWVMTAKEIRLVPDPNTAPLLVQGALF